MEKKKSGRICVTLPIEMLEDLRLRSEQTGISISKLIFHRLRTRKPIVLVPYSILESIRNLQNTIEKAIQKGVFDSVTLSILQNQADMFNNLVDVDSSVKFIKGRNK